MPNCSDSARHSLEEKGISVNFPSCPRIHAGYMLRPLVFFLVLANLLVYAWSAGYLGADSNSESKRLGQQISPEKIVIVGRSDKETNEAPAPLPPADPALQAPHVQTLCKYWDNLPYPLAQEIKRLISNKAPDITLKETPHWGEGHGWWVHIPPLGSKTEAEKKAGEVRRLGVTDYFLLTEAGPNQFAISLGLFSSEKGGQERLNEVKNKGIRSAKLVERVSKDSKSSVSLTGSQQELSDLQPALDKVLGKISASDCPP